jgi:hypothetical protein
MDHDASRCVLGAPEDEVSRVQGVTGGCGVWNFASLGHLVVE